MLEGKVEWIIYYGFVIYVCVYSIYVFEISDSKEMNELIFFCKKINYMNKNSFFLLCVLPAICNLSLEISENVSNISNSQRLQLTAKSLHPKQKEKS